VFAPMNDSSSPLKLSASPAYATLSAIIPVRFQLLDRQFLQGSRGIRKSVIVLDLQSPH
jgi:hypothetical protein